VEKRGQNGVVVLYASCFMHFYYMWVHLGSSSQRSWKRNNEEKMTDLWLPDSIAASCSPALQGKPIAFARIHSFMDMSSVLGEDCQGLFPLQT